MTFKRFSLLIFNTRRNIYYKKIFLINWEEKKIYQFCLKMICLFYVNTVTVFILANHWIFMYSKNQFALARLLFHWEYIKIFYYFSYRTFNNELIFIESALLIVGFRYKLIFYSVLYCKDLQFRENRCIYTVWDFISSERGVGNELVEKETVSLQHIFLVGSTCCLQCCILSFRFASFRVFSRTILMSS